MNSLHDQVVLYAVQAAGGYALFEGMIGFVFRVGHSLGLNNNDWFG
jgi:hypothetical protein